jgi:hypothetical protein
VTKRVPSQRASGEVGRRREAVAHAVDTEGSRSGDGQQLQPIGDGQATGDEVVGLA